MSSASAAAPPAAAPAAAAAPPERGPLTWSHSRSVRFMRLGNACNGVLLVTFAILSFLLPSGSLLPDFSSITLSCYVIFLGLLMCTVELNLSPVQARVRRNFGFLFSYLGRALFVAFSGSMAVAMAYSNGSASIILIAVGVATMANALVNLVIIYFNPAFGEGAGVPAVDLR